MKETIIIVGASITGLNAARTLVKNNYEGTIILIDRKSTYPYNPYPLSKEWLRGDDDTAPYLEEEAFYSMIDLRLSTNVTGFDPYEKVVILADNTKISYTKLLIATGSRLRKLNTEHDDAEGIFYLRTYLDALALKDFAKKAQDVVLIGGGFINLELASSLNQMGKNVTVLERASYPLGNILGQEVSQYIMRMHQNHGVRILTSVQSTEIRVNASNRVIAVETDLNQTLKADMLIIGIGVTPNLSLNHPELVLQNGAILVNEFNETSLRDVYAAGDVAIWPYNNANIHIEHWENAYNQGVFASKNMMSPHSSPYKIRPYFWSDQYDQTFEYLGHGAGWYKTVIRGDINTPDFSVAYVSKDNQVVAVLFANKFDKRKEVRQYMDRTVVFNEEKFKDASLRLNEIT